MKQILTMIQDGDGNTSCMRVVVLLIIACVVVPPAIAAIKSGQGIIWNDQDIAMIAAAIGGKVWQNNQEAKSSSITTVTTTPVKP